MASTERPADRGTRLGRVSLHRIGQELREARRDRGLSLAVVADSVGRSGAELSRIERGLSPMVPLVTLSRVAGVVGLDLATRLYPGPQPIRDAAHIALLETFRGLLHASLRWATEVPLPIVGDQRAWDALIRSRTAGASPGPLRQATRWMYGVEAETLPRDGQALQRRLQLKLRDGGVDGIILVLPETRRAHDFVRAWAGAAEAYPVAGRRALELLGAGVDPGGSAIVFVRPRR